MTSILRVIIIAAALLASAASHAVADSDVVVLGPAASGTVAAVNLKQVKAVLLRAAIGPAVDRQIDTACAANASCLATAGTELSAQRVLAVTVAQPGKGQLTIGLSLVDVVGKEMVAVRDVTIAEKKLAKELEPAIRKFLDEAPTDRAKTLYAEGNQHFNLNEMAQALELYKRAYRIKPLPAFLFNIAQCYRKLGNHQEAINMYQAYLVGVPDASNKEMVESLINESKTAIAEQQNRDQEKVKINADVEKTRLDTEKKKAEEARKAKEAEAVAAAERTRQEQARLAHDKEIYNRHPMRKWMIVTSVLAAGAIGAGGYFGVQANKAQQSFNSAGCGDPNQLLGVDQITKCNKDLATGNDDSTLANAFMIGGGAALLGSIIVFAIDPGNLSRPETPRAALRLTPNSIHLVLSW
jgi:tetratricopeptide (TPR) repeat protein